MGKKVLIITGSPRPKGNSNTLAASFAGGASAAGNEIKVFEAPGANMDGCHGDASCEKRGCCGLKDDGVIMNEYMRWADVLVLVSPVYWKSFTSQIKRVIDRFYQFSFPKGNATLGVKEAYLLATAGSPDMAIFDSMLAEFGLVCQLLGFENKGTLLCPGLGGPDEIKGHEDYLEQAVRMGMNI